MLIFTYSKLTNVYFVSPLILLLQYRYQKSLSNLRNNDSFSRVNNAFHSLTLLFLVPIQSSVTTAPLPRLNYYVAFQFLKFLCNILEKLEQVIQIQIDVLPLEVLACG